VADDIARSSSVLLDEWNIKEEREIIVKKIREVENANETFLFLFYTLQKMNQLEGGREKEQCEVLHLISLECR
jgi:hypothetical protein